MAHDTTDPHANLHPALRNALDAALSEFDEQLVDVQDAMRDVKRQHPEIGPFTQLNFGPDLGTHYYLDDTQIAERRALLATVRDQFCDILVNNPEPEAQQAALRELVQGGLHGATFLGNDYELWRMADRWIDKARELFLERAPVAVKAKYKPAFDTASQSGEICNIAYDTLRGLIHEQQRQAGAKPHELRDSCYDLALERYYHHYPSRRDRHLNKQEEYWVSNESKRVLEEVLEPYRAGLPQHIGPELAAFVALAADQHAPVHAHRGQADNDNLHLESPQVRERTNNTLRRLFDRYTDVAFDAKQLQAAWQALDRRPGPEQAQAGR